MIHHRKVASLNHFNSYYFGRCFLDWAELVSVSYSRGKPTHYFNKLYDFSFTSLRCYKDVYVNNFFSLRAVYSRILFLWNASFWLVIYMFLSLYLIGTCYFWTLSNQLSYMLFIFVSFFSSFYFVVAVHLCLEWIPFKFWNRPLVAHFVYETVTWNMKYGFVAWNFAEIELLCIYFSGIFDWIYLFHHH